MLVLYCSAQDQVVHITQQLATGNLIMKLFFLAIIAIFLCTSVAKAQPIIRDTELETAIRMIANPIFKSAGYKPSEINIYIVNSNDINAYVSGGKNIFIYTGLLSAAKNPHMLAGVIAHETGHIYGGHLLKGAEEAQRNMVKATVGYMLGLAAAAAGSPQAGAAIASGAQHVVERQALKYSRSNEEAADQSALDFLDKSDISSDGLLEMMEVLYGKEATMYNNNPYLMTHPLSRDRINHVRAHLNKTKVRDRYINDFTETMYKRAIVKLEAFLQPSEKTLKKFPSTDTSINAHYARAIAYYKIPRLPKALAEIDLLIKHSPTNPFFTELKGQILFENGKIVEAIKYYKKSAELLNNSALFKIQLATAQIASENDDYLQSAVKNLEQALRMEKNNTFAWHQLGIAYGRLGKLDMSNLALAEESIISGNKEDAKRFIKLAKKYTKSGSSAYLKIKDLETSLDMDKKK